MLPQNYDLCQRCLQGLLQCLRHNPTPLKEYDSIIQNQLQQGIVESVDQSIRTDESNNETLRSIHYMYISHHSIILQHKGTTKIRVVYELQQGVEAPP